MELIKRLLRTEPVRIAEVLSTIATLAAGVTDLIDPAQAATIIAAIVGVFEIIRSVVYAPATVEELVGVALTSDG